MALNRRILMVAGGIAVAASACLPAKASTPDDGSDATSDLSGRRGDMMDHGTATPMDAMGGSMEMDDMAQAGMPDVDDMRDMHDEMMADHPEMAAMRDEMMADDRDMAAMHDRMMGRD